MLRLVIRELFHAYDQLFQNIESGDLVVRIPDFGGAFEIGATSHILRRVLVESNYEPELLDLIRKKIDPARDAIDVGANIGLLTVFMARLVSGTSRVLAIEPPPEALRRLRGNIMLNGCDARVAIFEGGLTFVFCRCRRHLEKIPSGNCMRIIASGVTCGLRRNSRRGGCNSRET